MRGAEKVVRGELAAPAPLSTNPPAPAPALACCGLGERRPCAEFSRGMGEEITRLGDGFMRGDDVKRVGDPAAATASVTSVMCEGVAVAVEGGDESCLARQ